MRVRASSTRAGAFFVGGVVSVVLGGVVLGLSVVVRWWRHTSFRCGVVTACLFLFLAVVCCAVGHTFFSLSRSLSYLYSYLFVSLSVSFRLSYRLSYLLV